MPPGARRMALPTGTRRRPRLSSPAAGSTAGPTWTSTSEPSACRWQRSSVPGWTAGTPRISISTRPTCGRPWPSRSAPGWTAGQTGTRTSAHLAPRPLPPRSPRGSCRSCPISSRRTDCPTLLGEPNASYGACATTQRWLTGVPFSTSVSSVADPAGSRHLREAERSRHGQRTEPQEWSPDSPASPSESAVPSLARPLRQVVHRPRKPAFEPVRTRARSEVGSRCLDDPRQVLAGTAVQIRRRRYRHERHGKTLPQRQVVENMAEFLNDIPRERMVDVDRELHPPSAGPIVAVPHRGLHRRNSAQVVEQLREGALVHPHTLPGTQRTPPDDRSGRTSRLHLPKKWPEQAMRRRGLVRHPCDDVDTRRDGDECGRGHGA